MATCLDAAMQIGETVVSERDAIYLKELWLPIALERFAAIELETITLRKRVEELESKLAIATKHFTTEASIAHQQELAELAELEKEHAAMAKALNLKH